ncbi:uncharacterized protein LOC126656719 [Mercurialis annua]|uniref:uncharacterized protein LOC126656719 n=1 Tax=Mercurialis annua TaxID=3986 RepID=UPI00215FB99E|nr:uncharacterized protein LOC126656719 [Mercurialis annua]
MQSLGIFGTSFFNCPFTEAVWVGSEINSWTVHLLTLPVRSFWFSLVNSLKEETNRADILLKTVAIFWAIWKTLNTLIFREVDNNPLEVLQAASGYHLNFSSLNSRTALQAPVNNGSIPNATPPRWSPPQATELKFNFDGAFVKDSRTGTGACVVRNHQGRAVSSCAKRFDNVSSPAMIEALALREGILLARRLQVPNLIT